MIEPRHGEAASATSFEGAVANAVGGLGIPNAVRHRLRLIGRRRLLGGDAARH